MCPGHGASASSFAAGVRLGTGASAPVFVVGLTFGAAAVGSGWDALEACVFSVLAFSGSAQFTLLTALSSGTVLAAVTAAILINARYLIMSVALNDSLQGGRLRRAVHTQALVDASFVIAHRGEGRFDVARLAGASLPQWLAWVSGTTIGALAAPSAGVMHDLGLDTAFPAFFLMLALDELRASRRALLAAAVGAGVAAVMLLVTTAANALLAASVGALVGLVPPRGRGRNDADLA
jgi:4-azaleucine resistance transporter AzlC